MTKHKRGIALTSAMRSQDLSIISKVIREDRRTNRH